MQALLFGLNSDGQVVHTERMEWRCTGGSHPLAAERLPAFHTVEVWIESVRVLTLTRGRPPTSNS